MPRHADANAPTGSGGVGAAGRWTAVVVTVVLSWELFEAITFNGQAALPRRAPVQIQARAGEATPQTRQQASGSNCNGGSAAGGWAAAPDPSTGGAAGEVISSTGHLFEGDKVRSFHGPLVGLRLGAVARSSATDSGPRCPKWSVVTTIHLASEAVLVAAALAGWCTVIVGDTKTPQNYLTSALKANSRVVFIPHDAPIAGGPGDAIADYVRSVPFKHFARKNIGFLYAIQHGAEHIFDFDDDNILTGGMAPIPDGSSIGAVARLVSQSTGAINPYPMLGATVERSWPRGFPLQDINNKSTRGGGPGRTDPLTPEELGRVGVWQSAADGDPDVDAVHRMTKDNTKPYTFTPVGKGPTLILPPGTFVPYNAQATVHTKPTLWATLLPMTVPGRVSDIWRGYFAQRLFQDLGLSMAYLPPRVHQDRNPHNFLADMQAEGALYFKTGTLLEFLHSWDGGGATTLPESIEKLWIAVYERSYIEREDVLAMQRWLKALVAAGYVFPSLQRGSNQGRATTVGKAVDSQTAPAAHGARKWPCNVIPPGTPPPPPAEHPDPSTITSKVLWPSAANIAIGHSGRWGDNHRAIVGIGNRLIALIAGVIETVSVPGAALTFRDYNESDADTLWPALAALTVAPEKVEGVKEHRWFQPGSNGKGLMLESLFSKFEQRRDVICQHFRFSTPPPRMLPGPDDIVVAFRTYANELDRLHDKNTTTYDNLLPMLPPKWPSYVSRNSEMPYAYYDRIIRKGEYAKVWILVDPHNHEHPLVKRLVEVHNAEIHPGKSELEDFRFLSYANHIVLSPSTFYYWGAFLANDATTIHYGVGGSFPTGWCAAMMRHMPELRSRVQFHDIFSDRTWPQTEAGALDAHAYCTRWENDELYTQGAKMNASSVRQIQTQYCEGMSCDVKSSPMIEIDKAIIGQPDPNSDRVHVGFRCGQLDWLGVVDGASGCQQKVLAMPAAQCSHQYFVLADLGDRNCACAPPDANCTLGSPDSRVAKASSLYRVTQGQAMPAQTTVSCATVQARCRARQDKP